MTPAQRGAQTRARHASLQAYCDKFGGFTGHLTRDVERAIQSALKTGKDHPLLIGIKKENARNHAKAKAELAAEHAAPFTPELEKHYTARVKNRRLIEGDCQRPWQNYFDYRAMHASDVAPLTAQDLAYAGQWTSCARRAAA